jgi:hypothetical protein
MAVHRELQCDIGRLHSQAIVHCEKAFRNWQDGQGLGREDESVIMNLRDQARSLHRENVALYAQIQGGGIPFEGDAKLGLSETENANAPSYQLAPNPGQHSRGKLLGYGNSTINWGTNHHELAPDFEAALCQLPMNIPFFDGMFVTCGGIHYHVDDPQLQRAIALRDYSIDPPIPPKTKTKKLKTKGLKRKKKKLVAESSSSEPIAPRVRTRHADAEDALARRARARAHDFFDDLVGKKQQVSPNPTSSLT